MKKNKNLKNNSSEKQATEQPRQYAIVKCRERVGNGSMYKSIGCNASIRIGVQISRTNIEAMQVWQPTIRAALWTQVENHQSKLAS